MAVEIMMQKYKFLPREQPKGPLSLTNYTSEDYDKVFQSALALEDNKGTKCTRVDEQGIWANYLHDIESILWIAIWTLFNFESAPMATLISEKAKMIRKSQSYVNNLLLSGYMDYRDRMSFLFDSEQFERIINSVSDQLKG